MNRLAATIAVIIVISSGCAHVAARRESKPASAHVHAGADALTAGDLDRAEAEFQLALRYEPALPHALNGLGLVAMARGDGAAARGWFGQALRANPDFAEAHANLGALELGDGRAEAALPHLEAALEIDPGYVPARHTLARALVRLGRLAEAREEYMLLTSTAREDATAWAELAAVELALGHRAAAGRAAAQALALAAGQPIARRVQADLLRDDGELEAALAIYDELCADDADDVEALIGRGMTLLMLDRGAAARRDLERAVLLAPESAAARFALGVAAVVEGDDAAAVVAFERAAEIAAAQGRPYPQAHYLRGAALARLGRGAAAAAAYRQFLLEAEGDATLAGAVADARKQLAVLER